MILSKLGNSSRLNFLNTFPIFKTYFSGSSSKCVAISGVSFRIVLNLYIINMVLYIPIRFCLKKTGKPSFVIIKMPTNRKKGDKRRSNKNAIIRLLILNQLNLYSDRYILIFYPDYKYCL